MSVPAESPRFTLRDLPLPAKIVITCFLLSVGLGYTAAMVQLHFQDSRSGQPMPTPADVVLKFTGKKWFTDPPPPPASKFVKLITTSSGSFNGTGTMLPAFFEKDHSFRKALGTGADETKLRGEREGERDALVAWARSPADERKKAFETDHFGLAPDEMPRSITEKFKDGSAVKVRSIILERCTRCHKKGGDDSKAEQYLLETYEQIDKYVVVPDAIPFKAGGDWVKVEEPISLEKLTQSTHAHLLSFAVLFSLTGLVFAFTSYPTLVRCIVSPLVLLAIVTDVVFWWLARLSDGYGVFFAHGIIGTGGIAGLGLGAQITLGLWNMYGPKGKAVILILFAIGAGLFGLVFVSVIKPGLDAKHAPREEVKVDGNGNGAAVNNNAGKDIPRRPSAMERVLMFPFKGPDGTDLPLLGMPFDKKDGPKNMVRAFFDKDKAEFADAIKNKDKAEQDRLTPERHGERIAMTVWLKLPEAEQRSAFEGNSLPLPAELVGKPFTKDYLANGKVKIKSIIGDRCASCHDGDANVDFDDKDFAKLKKFLEPEPAKK